MTTEGKDATADLDGKVFYAMKHVRRLAIVPLHVSNCKLYSLPRSEGRWVGRGRGRDLGMMAINRNILNCNCLSTTKHRHPNSALSGLFRCVISIREGYLLRFRARTELAVTAYVFVKMMPHATL